MIRRHSQPLIAWFFVSDVLAAGVSWVGAYHIRFSGLLPIYREQPNPWDCYNNTPVVMLLAVVAYRLAGLYQIHRLRRLREDALASLKGMALLTLFIMAAGFYRQDPYVSRGAMSIFTPLSFLLVLSIRRATWAYVHWLRRRGKNPSFSLIVGSGRLARKTARSLRKASWMGIRNVGFVEDHPTQWSSDLDILGKVEDLPKLIEQYQIEHVFIAYGMKRIHEARKVFDVLSDTLVEVRLTLDVPALSGVSLTTGNLDGIPLVSLREGPHYGINVWVKRVMDIVIASLALVVLSPLMLLIALLVKLTSPGPIFHRQIRTGLNGVQFNMLKFRSMHVNAEQGGAQMATPDDKRRTRLGTFLRKTSLDELPQFINVLKGDMSVVGPRPERPEFIQKFRKTIPNYMARHAVKCGITGWAQVNGWRGNTSLRKRVQYDLYYITHWTPWFDLRIMFMTIWKGFVNRNAY